MEVGCTIEGKTVATIKKVDGVGIDELYIENMDAVRVEIYKDGIICLVASNVRNEHDGIWYDTEVIINPEKKTITIEATDVSSDTRNYEKTKTRTIEWFTKKKSKEKL